MKDSWIKTANKYGFDSLLLSDCAIRVIDDYIMYVRPRLQPKCDYVLVTCNGKQYSKLSNLMCKMVYEAIGKYIHPTRNRQIVETESARALNKEEQKAVSLDQKHSSIVARVNYQKTCSRDIATKAQQCMRKLQGNKGSEVHECIQSKLCSFEKHDDVLPATLIQEQELQETPQLQQSQVVSDQKKDDDKQYKGSCGKGGTIRLSSPQQGFNTSDNAQGPHRLPLKPLWFNRGEDANLKKG